MALCSSSRERTYLHANHIHPASGASLLRMKSFERYCRMGGNGADKAAVRSLNRAPAGLVGRSLLNRKRGMRLGPAMTPAKSKASWEERGKAARARRGEMAGGNGAMSAGMPRNQIGNMPPSTLPSTVVIRERVMFRLKRYVRSSDVLFAVK